MWGVEKREIERDWKRNNEREKESEREREKGREQEIKKLRKYNNTVKITFGINSNYMSL